MRPIHIAHLDTARPVLILTREIARTAMAKVTVAPITSTVRGLSSELPLGPPNGLDHACVVSLDNITTIRAEDLGRHVGFLLAHQEAELTRALARAFDLEL